MAAPNSAQPLIPGGGREGEDMKKLITQDDINRFAELSGDRNPVHVDPEYAKETRFGGTIAHGMFSASLISAAIAAKYEGSIYVSQELTFLRPVRPGDELSVEVLEGETAREGGRLTLRTTVRNQVGKAVLDGNAVVLWDDK